MYGGLVLGAGGGGLEEGLRQAQMVLEFGQPRLADLDDFEDGDLAIVTTGVGAPGGHTSSVFPRDRLRAFELIRAAIAQREDTRNGRLVGTVMGHPSARVATSWLHAALDPNIVVLDCATNGRGHPSVRMGGMGLASRLDVAIFQAAVGGTLADRGRMELVVWGPLALTSDVVRRASDVLGGGISACRGPVSIGFLRTAAAVGSVSMSIHLGRAMIAALGRGPDAFIDAIVSTLNANVVLAGLVTEQTVRLRGAYDVGCVVVADGGHVAELGVVNEFLTLDVDGIRMSSFPDLIVLLSQKDGMPIGITALKRGDPVIIVTVPHASIPLGAGVWDVQAYRGVEELLDRELVPPACRRDSAADGHAEGTESARRS